ncbi:MAG TPA: corrinoid protein, partial [Chloroflexota bacterium]
MDLKGLMDAIIVGDADTAVKHVQQGIEEGVDPQVMIQEAMIPAMQEVGDRFARNEYYVPEMLVAARAMQKGLDLLRPLMVGEKAVEPIGKAVIGTVKGDLHDIGKNLLGIMLEGAGFEVIDLGRDTKPEKFVNAVREHQPQVVGMSALLTTTMPNMRVTINALKEAGLRDKVKIMVGGAPLTPRYAEESGADAYAPDAATAVKIAKKFCGIEEG